MGKMKAVISLEMLEYSKLDSISQTAKPSDEELHEAEQCYAWAPGLRCSPVVDRGHATTILGA